MYSFFEWQLLGREWNMKGNPFGKSLKNPALEEGYSRVWKTPLSCDMNK